MIQKKRTICLSFFFALSILAIQIIARENKYPSELTTNNSSCVTSLGTFDTMYCVEQHDDGSFTMKVKLENNEFYDNTYAEDGTLLSSQPIEPFIDSIFVQDNAIVEKGINGSILNTTPIDTDLVNLYTTGDNHFGSAAKREDGSYLLIG